MGELDSRFSDFHNISPKYAVEVLYQIHCVLENNSKMVLGILVLSTHLNSIFLNSFSNNSSSSIASRSNRFRLWSGFTVHMGGP